MLANEPSLWSLLLVGAAAGLLSGFLGLGGGLIIVPALVYILGFSQQMATGTSLAILLPPVGLAAVLEYHRHGHINLRAAVFIAIGLFFSAWISAHFANKLPQIYLRLIFGAMMIFIGIFIVATNWNKWPR